MRVLVADDHPVVRAGTVALFEREPEFCVVFEAGNGGEALEGWKSIAPDVGFVDLSMPVLDGFETVAAIRRFSPDARLVVMTTLCGEQDVFRALKASASGYLLKDCGHAELATCVRAVARGQRYLQTAAATSLADRMAASDLTGRESDVLNGLAQGLSNKGIARQLGVAEGTVKTHVKALLGKLGAVSRTHAVHLAMQRARLESDIQR